MGCALAVHAQGLLSTLLSHALCVVPRNEKHTPQHKHRAHGDDSPRKGRFVKVVTPRKVLEVEEGAAAQGDGADETALSWAIIAMSAMFMLWSILLIARDYAESVREKRRQKALGVDRKRTVSVVAETPPAETFTPLD